MTPALVPLVNHVPLGVLVSGTGNGAESLTKNPMFPLVNDKCVYTHTRARARAEKAKTPKP